MSTVLRSANDVIQNVEPQILRRSSRIAAKATKPAVVITMVSQPAVIQPALVTKDMIVKTIDNYLYSLECMADTFTKVRITVDLFDFIDKHFDFINTEEFQSSKRFVLVVHDKTIELERDLGQQIEKRGRSMNAEFWKNEYIVYSRAMKLVQRVHTKCHLYGMDKFVTSDPVYKNFLDTYMDKFL
jgi:hypothetical protein